MKNQIARLFFFLLASSCFAQTDLFQKITIGAHVTTPSDSRSVNFVDVNNDGWDDLFITNGPQGGAANLLYLNDGAGNLLPVSSDPIVSHSQPFDGATFADFNNDGHLDAFVVTWYGAKNFLYTGNGDGSFSYLADASPSSLGTFSETASWGDFDLDGDLDLYATNSGGTLKNLFYRNDGGQAFTLLTNVGAVVTDAHASRSVNWTDFDLDGDLDLYVSNESGQKDDCYENQNGTFVKWTTAGAPGQTNHSSMSSNWGDVDNDGDLDLFVANSGNFTGQNNQLFINDNGSFSPVATGDLVTDGGCSFGSNFADYDNDGDLDLMVSNGFCSGSIVLFLYKNDGQGQFSRDLTSAPDLSTPCSYGAAWGDVNNDGFLDLAVATCKNSSAAPLPGNLFFLNNGNGNNWLKIKLTGSPNNPSAIGAKVWVKATINGQSVTQMREISAQSGHCGQNSLTAHFGLADATIVEEVRVKFLGGAEAVYTSFFPNQVVEIKENEPPTNTTNSAEIGLEVNVFPNPAADTMTVEVAMPKATDWMKLRVTDLSGRLLFEKMYGPVTGTTQVTVSKKDWGMTSGPHYLVVEVEGQTRTVLIH